MNASDWPTVTLKLVTQKKKKKKKSMTMPHRCTFNLYNIGHRVQLVGKRSRLMHQKIRFFRTSAQSFQAGAVVLLHPLVSVLQQQADRCGSPVKLVYLQSLDHLPVPSCGQTQSVRAVIISSVAEMFISQ